MVAMIASLLVSVGAHERSCEHGDIQVQTLSFPSSFMQTGKRTAMQSIKCMRGGSLTGTRAL